MFWNICSRPGLPLGTELRFFNICGKNLFMTFRSGKFHKKLAPKKSSDLSSVTYLTSEAIYVTI